MIPHLPSPAVCVIDDEEADYGPILDALLGVGLGCVHVRGNTMDSLPLAPFKGLRVVFTDLHLTAATGKDAASHTANVFTKVVSSKTAPVVVVIWSKYADDEANVPDVPKDDQPTEADQFKTTLLAAEPAFEKRLIFVEMPKPKPGDRPKEEGKWVETLKTQIGEALKGLDAFSALWAWEALIHEAGLEVSANLLEIALSLLDQGHAKNDLAKPEGQLRLLLKLLSQQQGGPDCAAATAPRHLLTVLSHLGQDEIERLSSEKLQDHGDWLAEALNVELKKKCKTSKLNSILLTCQANPSFAAFSPGTVFSVTDTQACQEATGLNASKIVADCCNKKEVPADFAAGVTPVVIEITPACDFHQGHRRSALLVGGVVCPESLLSKAESKDACKKTPLFEDRFAGAEPSNVALVLSSRHRITLNHDALPEWLAPRMRIRDGLMADIRNWYAGQTARAGYLSF